LQIIYLRIKSVFSGSLSRKMVFCRRPLVFLPVRTAEALRRCLQRDVKF